MMGPFSAPILVHILEQQFHQQLLQLEGLYISSLQQTQVLQH